MKKILSLLLVLSMLLSAALLLFSCGEESGSENSQAQNESHVCPAPEIGENGNWWVGGKDTGTPSKLEITNTQASFVTVAGVDYCMVELTFSDGSTKTVLAELEADNKDFVSKASITNGYGGANGIVCLMTDNDNGKFETLALIDELYIKYGLVGGLGTVTKNLYNDKAYTSPKTADIAKWQEFLDTGRWKIINHSMTHTTYMDTVDGQKVINEQRLYDELVRSAELLRQLFPGERVLTYAMTGTQSAIGESSDPNNIRECERELISEYYIGGRFQYTGAVEFDKLQWNNLPYALLSTKNLPTILNNIDRAATEGKYYMVYNHYVIEDELIDTVSASSWTTKSTAEALCERVAQYVNDGSLWCAHFEDAVMYMREAQTAQALASYDNGKINVLLTDKMDDEIYNHKLTVKLTVPDSWAAVKITQGDDVSYAEVKAEGYESFVLANILPDGAIATVEPISKDSLPEVKPEEIKPTPDITSPSTPSTPTTPPSAEIPDIYTFDTLDGYLGSTITFDNGGSETTKITATDDGGEKVLKLEKPDGSTNPIVTFKAKDLSGADSTVIEFKIKLERTSTSGDVYINLVGPSGAYAYRSYIQVNSNGTLKLTDYRSGDTSKANSASFGSLGEWIDMRLVYTVSGGTATITVYSGDTLLLTSNNHYVAASEPIPAEDISAFRFNLSQKYLGNIYLDNLSIAAE